jgi:glycosyltransferase involved in cell wall biosynthesis
MPPVRVSVIIPAFRRARMLMAALSSVQEQTFSEFEVIVVDDHSEDGGETRAVVESLNDPRFIYLQLESRRGPAGARNAASRLCRGEYVSFLDSDDLLRPEKLARHVHLLDHDPDVAMVYSDEYIMGPDGRISPSAAAAQRGGALPSGRIARDFVRESFVATMTVTVRRNVLIELGGFDETMEFNEDDDLWFRIMLRHKVVCSDYVAGVRRLHAHNMSMDTGRMVSCQIECMEKYMGSVPDFVVENRQLFLLRLRRTMKSYGWSRLRRFRFPRMTVLRAYLGARRRLRALSLPGGKDD